MEGATVTQPGRDAFSRLAMHSRQLRQAAGTRRCCLDVSSLHTYVWLKFATLNIHNLERMRSMYLMETHIR